MPSKRNDPALLRRLVSQLKRNGKSSVAARRIATSALQKSGNLKPGTTQATEQGRKRGLMTPAQRAIDRAKRQGKSGTHYNPHNNTAVKGPINPNVKHRA